MMTSLNSTLIIPSWPAPENVKAIQTTRQGGVSQPPYNALNLATHVDDLPKYVAQNRQLLNEYVPTEPVWLNQIHSTQVVDAAQSQCLVDADASYTNQPNVVCVTMTADCLPVLLCDQAGTTVAAVHAGWRGLCDGVIETTVDAMPVAANKLIAWLGPAIGPTAFEVGSEVRQQFIQHDLQASDAFLPKGNKWLANLYLIAKQRLTVLGVSQIFGDVQCTYSDADRFFSFRREQNTGRMATMIWLAA